MTAIRRSAFLAPLLVFLLVPAAFGDVIVLKSGYRQSGKIVEETEKHVVIEVEGIGRITIQREAILEILRGDPSAKEEPEEEKSDLLRVEDSFVWSGERRVGTRSVRVRKLENGDLQFEEDSTFYDDKGAVDVRLFLVERVNPALEPRSIVFRSHAKDGLSALSGEVREGYLHVALSLPGERRKNRFRMPEGVRFPLSAREQVIRERKRIKGSYEIQVFDPREENYFRKLVFGVDPVRKVDWEGEVVEVTIIQRDRGDRKREEIWVEAGGSVITEQLNGPAVVAIRTTPERLAAFKEGKQVEESAGEKRVRPLFVHPEAGFRITKPGLAWEFKSVKTDDEHVLSLSNLRYFAYVDVFVMDGVPEGSLLSALAVQMEKRFQANSKDFEKLSDGFLEVGGEKAHRIVATSMNKDEKIKSFLVGFLHGDRTWYVTLSAPVRYFEEAKPEFEEILASFEFIGGEK